MAVIGRVGIKLANIDIMLIHAINIIIIIVNNLQLV